MKNNWQPVSEKEANDEDYIDAQVEYVDNLLTAMFSKEHAAGHVTQETKERAIATICEATLVSRERAKRLMHKWFSPNQ